MQLGLCNVFCIQISKQESALKTGLYVKGQMSRMQDFLFTNLISELSSVKDYMHKKHRSDRLLNAAVTLGGGLQHEGTRISQ